MTLSRLCNHPKQHSASSFFLIFEEVLEDNKPNHHFSGFSNPDINKSEESDQVNNLLRYPPPHRTRRADSPFPVIFLHLLEGEQEVYLRLPFPSAHLTSPFSSSLLSASTTHRVFSTRVELSLRSGEREPRGGGNGRSRVGIYGIASSPLAGDRTHR